VSSRKGPLNHTIHPSLALARLGPVTPLDNPSSSFGLQRQPPIVSEDRPGRDCDSSSPPLSMKYEAAQGMETGLLRVIPPTSKFVVCPYNTARLCCRSPTRCLGAGSLRRVSQARRRDKPPTAQPQPLFSLVQDLVACKSKAG